jgi:hypothetical protein
MLRRAFLALGLAGLPFGLGYSASPTRMRMVVTIDALSAPEPVSLDELARAAGDTGDPWMPFPLTVVAVVSPQEFVVRGRYGLERVRPALALDVVNRIERLGSDADELVRRLRDRLEGRTLLEPPLLGPPLLSSEGLRVVPVWVGKSCDLGRLIGVQIEGLEKERGGERGAGDPDLAVLTPNDELLREETRRAVELAERWSDFRAPPELSVAWIRRPDALAVASSLDRTFEPLVGTCFPAADTHLADDLGWDGVSLPDGRILLDRDREWRRLTLRFVLLHELMHQHQYALCRTGRATACALPNLLRQGHASLLAREILRQDGMSEQRLDLLQVCDRDSAGVQAFDDARRRLGLSPDETFAWLSSHRREAKALEEDRYFVTEGCSAREAGLCAERELEFEYLGVTAQGKAIVAIVNPSDRPFAGFATGWWHRTGHGYAGGESFTILLPAHGRITVETGVEPDESKELRAGYHETPAPVFDA